MLLITIKIILSALMVLGLIYISEKSPRLGGLFSGLPLSVGLFTYFYARENGLQFLIDSMPYAFAGFCCTLLFTIGFYLGGKLFLNNRYFNTLSALFVGFVIYFISGYILTKFSINIFSGFMIFLVAMFITILFFRRVADNKHTKVAVKLKPANKLIVITFRIILVASLVLVITGVSRIVGHEWAGIFSSFPVMLTSVTTVLIFTYKDQLFPGVLKHFSYGVSILLIYDLLIYWLYPIMGINWGTLAAYIVCFIYLSLLNKLNQ
ncbi:MFS transporter [Francisella salimarina]|uniref:MFS transporter n=1 Tax=Francisella salimarina TaxID=2599927 RepID=A0AAJ4NMM4_9GAMM|nr:MFS transporter [Francisella salimarina]QWU98567.1 MFS transporter [Francisella salimarina]